MSTISQAALFLKRPAAFEVCVALSQIFGFSMVILTGYVFNTNGLGIVWPTKKFDAGTTNPNDLKNFHGFFMITGLVFFQGEALISYRLYRHELKILSKFIHVVFHMLAIGFFATALACVIIQKNNTGTDDNPAPHFTSVHSWIGLAVMSVYLVQFSFGALNFLNPLMSVSVKAAFMPYHRVIGCVSFIACNIQAIIGHTEYIMSAANKGTFYGCYWSLNCTTRLDLIYNFSMVAMICYCLTVLMIVVPTPWRREKTLDEMK